MILTDAILSGIWATVVMDTLAKILAKKKLICPFITKQELGRWFIYMFRGKFTHKNISKVPPLKHEKTGYYLSHYLIGILLAGIYLLISNSIETINENDWLTIVFGILTVLLPWFWLLPATGLGFMAAKSSKRKLIIQTNLFNHTNFGIGLYLWLILFQNSLISI